MKTMPSGLKAVVFATALLCGACAGVAESARPSSTGVEEEADMTAASWRTLDLDNGNGQARVAVKDGTATVEGCLRRDLTPVAGAAPLFEASAGIFLPETAGEWASAALTVFGPEDGQRLYGMVVLSRPGLAADEVEVGFHGKSMKTVKLPRNAWARLRVSLDEKQLRFKAWPADAKEPEAWDVTLPAGALEWAPAGFGPRTFNLAGQFRDVGASLKAGPPPRWRQAVPEPVFSQDPSLVALYWKAWELAHQHVKTAEGMPQSPYMDEACYDDAIWIWDTCFMSLFCRYAPDEFPGVESLRNFYLPLHTGAKLPIACHIADNPPLFAWAEMANYRVSGDTAHLRKLVLEDQFLQKHYRFFENMKPGFRLPGNSSNAVLRKHELGFFWDSGHSGMDNTPRGRSDKGPTPQHLGRTNILWVDALAQQGLSALYISRACEALGDAKQAAEWRAEYERLKGLANKYYWDEKDGIYYDIDANTHAFSRVRTAASYWPMLAEMCSKEQAARLAAHIRDPKAFGGFIPWVTLARDDKDFAPDGNYWRGAVWLPTAYMGIKALEKYGYNDLADETAWTIIQHMNATYKTYKPATIWECYHPSKYEPSTEYGRRARPDFCGWSALGPISLFIENVLGFYDIDAPAKTIRWRLTRAGEVGIRHLRFGGITTDIVHDGAGTVRVKSTAPYTLVVNGRSLAVKAGEQRFHLPAFPR